MKLRIRGEVSRIKMVIRREGIIRGEIGIATTWICTKSFWCLRPMDELLSFRSVRVSFGVQPKNQKLAGLYCCEPLSVNKGSLTPVFRITI